MSMQYTYNGDEKKRLDHFLHEQLPKISRSQIQKFIKSNTISVNEKKASVHHWLRNGDTITGPDFSTPEKIVDTNTPKPSVIFEDDDLIVLEKPAGLLIHPTEQNENFSLSQWLVSRDPSIASVGDDPKRPGIVHRLDKDVGGLVVAAKTQESFEHLKHLFQERTIIKQYYALVHGVLESNNGDITTPLRRSKSLGRMVADSGTSEGKSAHTVYTVVERFSKYSLLNLQLKTGRTHQIRAHLFSIGHSIVGDPLYRTRDLKKKKQTDICTRPFLFAYYLKFTDRIGKIHEYTLDLPEEFKELLNTLRS